MHVSSQESQSGKARPRQGNPGVRARTRKLLLDTAMQLMQAGRVPSVTDVAEAAEVSRATAYRYFPTQAALVQAAVDEALGPILGWRSDLPDAEDRIDGLLCFAYPRLDEYEATLRAALLQAMDQWSRRRAGTLGDEAPIVRGNRKAVLYNALAPLRAPDGRRELRPAAAVAVAGLRHRGLRGAEGHLGPRRRRRRATWRSGRRTRWCARRSRRPRRRGGSGGRQAGLGIG